MPALVSASEQASAIVVVLTHPRLAGHPPGASSGSRCSPSGPRTPRANGVPEPSCWLHRR